MVLCGFVDSEYALVQDAMHRLDPPVVRCTQVAPTDEEQDTRLCILWFTAVKIVTKYLFGLDNLNFGRKHSHSFCHSLKCSGRDPEDFG